MSDALIHPAGDFVVVTPNDSTDLPLGKTRGIYVGVAGDVVMHNGSGNNVTWTALAAGVIHPIRTSRVLSAGTAATSILAVY